MTGQNFGASPISMLPVFEDEAYFADAKFIGEASFRGALFEELAFFLLLHSIRKHISGSRYVGEANFQNANFLGEADFEKGHFCSFNSIRQC